MSNPDPQTPKTKSPQNSSNAENEEPAQWRNAQAVNQHGFRENADIAVEPFPSSAATIFRSTTIAPSPPPSAAFSNNPTLTPLNTASRLLPTGTPSQNSSPLSAGLRVQTDVIPNYTITAASANSTAPEPIELKRTPSKSANIPMKPIARTPSIKNILASSVGSSSNFGSAPNSALSSPMLNALADVTPLPSPLMSGDSPGPWKKLESRPASRDLMIPTTANSALVTANGESLSSAIANQSKRRATRGCWAVPRSPVSIIVSEYVPEAMQVPKSRHITVSGSHVPILDPTPDSVASLDGQMRREPHLAVQRGLASIPGPPTPPLSRTGGESSDSDSSLTTASLTKTKKPHYEYFDAHTRSDSKKRRWRALKILGQGTFSKVMLATSQIPEEDDRIDENDVFGQQMEGLVTPEPKIDRKKLVAIKICEHGPKGGASEERVEMSLKRELEIMKTISHPSLVHLKAWSIEETRAILVLSYCPGGDLFEVASQHRDLLVPGLLRRMFAELVGAVQYLHERHIVHRDIKLENVLVNLPQQELSRTLDWTTYPNSIITLTDLGLSRRVADD
ncbi:Serine/threonine-protein kinase ppk27, partial [Lachnellula suecica]